MMIAVSLMVRIHRDWDRSNKIAAAGMITVSDVIAEWRTFGTPGRRSRPVPRAGVRRRISHAASFGWACCRRTGHRLP